MLWVHTHACTVLSHSLLLVHAHHIVPVDCLLTDGDPHLAVLLQQGMLIWLPAAWHGEQAGVGCCSACWQGLGLTAGQSMVLPVCALQQPTWQPYVLAG